jgi:hypothetical protein
MKITKLIIFQAMFYALCGMSTVATCEQNNPQKMKFFNKKTQSCEQNKETFKKKVEADVSDIVNGKTNHPRILKYFVKQYAQDLIELAIWFNEQTNSMAACEYKDENEALQELHEDAKRISKENELPSWQSETAYWCASEWRHNQTSACKNLAHAYDSFRLHSQGVPENRKLKSLDQQISFHYDDKYTVAFLEKAKKRLLDDLKKIDAPLFNSLKESSTQYPLGNNPSYFESLSEEDKTTLITIIEDVVCEKITDFDKLAEEFQKTFYVFNEKAARKHLNEKEALKDLYEDTKQHSITALRCEREWAYGHKSLECKRLAHAYKNLRSYSSMHEIKKINSLHNQISVLTRLYTRSNNKPTIAFLKEEKEKLEQEVKNHNNGHIPTNISSYFESLSEEDQKEVTTIIKNAVKTKTINTDDLAKEFQKIFDIFNEKL